jgi:hypothetical protein
MSCTQIEVHVTKTLGRHETLIHYPSQELHALKQSHYIKAQYTHTHRCGYTKCINSAQTQYNKHHTKFQTHYQITQHILHSHMQTVDDYQQTIITTFHVLRHYTHARKTTMKAQIFRAIHLTQPNHTRCTRFKQRITTNKHKQIVQA